MKAEPDAGQYEGQEVEVTKKGMIIDVFGVIDILKEREVVGKGDDENEERYEKNSFFSAFSIGSSRSEGPHG